MMKLPDLFRSKERPEGLEKLAAQLLPRKLPERVADLARALALRSELQAVQDGRPFTTPTLHAAINRRLRALDPLLARMQMAARMQGCAPRIAEDRAAVASRVSAASADVESHERVAQAARSRFDDLDARLARLVQQEEATRTAGLASVEAAQVSVRAAVEAGDDVAEEAAARAQAEAASQADTAGRALAIRITETRRLRDSAAVDVDQAEGTLRERMQALHAARLEAAAIDADAALNAASVALFALVVARAAAHGAGVANVDSRYSLPSVVRVFSAGRVWFADGHDQAGPADARIGDKLIQLHRLLSSELPDLSILSQPLPRASAPESTAV